MEKACWEVEVGIGHSAAAQNTSRRDLRIYIMEKRSFVE